MDELMLDGNAIAGLLQEVFAAEMTTATGTCDRCGAAGPVGAVHVYRGAGIVLRSPDRPSRSHPAAPPSEGMHRRSDTGIQAGSGRWASPAREQCPPPGCQQSPAVTRAGLPAPRAVRTTPRLARSPRPPPHTPNKLACVSPHPRSAQLPTARNW